MALGNHDLKNRFSYHSPPNQERADKHEEIRGILLSAAQDIDELVPDGREKSSAISNLELAMFWANAGLARQETSQ